MAHAWCRVAVIVIRIGRVLCAILAPKDGLASIAQRQFAAMDVYTEHVVFQEIVIAILISRVASATNVQVLTQASTVPFVWQSISFV